MSSGQPPKVWVLLGKGAGGNAQMLNLVAALGWPHETRQLEFYAWNVIPNILVGASLFTLTRKSSATLSPPWPDLVIAASRRSVPIARWIRKQSCNRTRLVHLFHTMAPFNWFDLIITLPQYGLPERPNILQLTMPLHRLPRAKIAAAAAKWEPRLRALPRPWFAVLIGGNSSRYLLNAKTALRLAREASAWAMEAGGSLLVSTSPRTSSQAANASIEAIFVPRHVYRWQPDDSDNPYLAYIGLADGFMVTADSASQLAEAFATGRTVRIFNLPLRPQQRFSPVAILHGWLNKSPGSDSPFRRLMRSAYERLIEEGFVKPPRDFARYHSLLRGRSAVRAPAHPAGAAQEFDDLDRAVAAVRELFGAKERAS